MPGNNSSTEMVVSIVNDVNYLKFDDEISEDRSRSSSTESDAQTGPRRRYGSYPANLGLYRKSFRLSEEEKQALASNPKACKLLGMTQDGKELGRTKSWSNLLAKRSFSSRTLLRKLSFSAGSSDGSASVQQPKSFTRSSLAA